MTDRELMQMALDALIDAADSQSWEMQQNIDQHGEWYRRSVYLKQATAKSQETIEPLRARLAQPEPEELARLEQAMIEAWKPIPQREWQGLTENEIKHLWYEACQTNLELTSQLVVHLARNVEAKLKEKNN